VPAVTDPAGRRALLDAVRNLKAAPPNGWRALRFFRCSPAVLRRPRSSRLSVSRPRVGGAHAVRPRHVPARGEVRARRAGKHAALNFVVSVYASPGCGRRVAIRQGEAAAAWERRRLACGARVGALPRAPSVRAALALGFERRELGTARRTVVGGRQCAQALLLRAPRWHRSAARKKTRAHGRSRLRPVATGNERHGEE